MVRFRRAQSMVAGAVLSLSIPLVLRASDVPAIVADSASRTAPPAKIEHQPAPATKHKAAPKAKPAAPRNSGEPRESVQDQPWETDFYVENAFTTERVLPFQLSSAP